MGIKVPRTTFFIVDSFPICKKLENKVLPDGSPLDDKPVFLEYV
jgi:hypothetical protein